MKLITYSFFLLLTVSVLAQNPADLNADGSIDETGNRLADKSLIILEIGDVVNTLPTPTDRCQGLTWDGKTLWTSDNVVDTIYQISPADGMVLNQFPAPGRSIEGLAWDGTYLWAIDNGTGSQDADSAFQINTADSSVIHSFRLADGGWPHGGTWDGDYLWVHNFQTNTLQKVDSDNGDVLNTIPTPATQGIGLTWDGGYLWTSDFGLDSLFQIDTTDGSVVRAIKSPDLNPRDLAWDGAFLWLVSWQWETIYQIEIDVASTISEINPVASGFDLKPNFPNPFNPITHIPYKVSQPGHVLIQIFDMSGREVRRLLDDQKPAGSYTVTWDGRDSAGALAASATYIYSLIVNDQQLSRKMILIK
jgi:glutamine cyclotransferase